MEHPPTAGPAAAAPRPRVDYIATGGMIASVRDDDSLGATPTLTAADIAGSVAGIDKVADLRPGQFLQQSSPSMTIGDLLRLRDEMAARVAGGACALVITQGTDTIEETAFVLDLL